MDVSVILASYNKHPQTLFSLYALQNQAYPPSKMEVIVVDDCSPDGTPCLANFEAPFRYRYLRNPERLDRAGAKNVGLQHAEGELVIFLGGEILVPPDCVAGHVGRHRATENAVVSGAFNHFCTYTVLYPQFARDQVSRLFSLLQHQPSLAERLAKRLGMSFPPKNFNRFWQAARNNRARIPLLTEADIGSFHYEKLSFPKPHYPRVKEAFGSSLNGYCLPWTFFIARNVSVKKRILHAVGPFNERFRGWGYEDWELGYRLCREGAAFIEGEEISTYHQEHQFPRQTRRERAGNYLTFMHLHPVFEVSAFALNLLGKNDLLQIHKIIGDGCRAKGEYPGPYPALEEAFVGLTRQALLQLWRGEPVTGLLEKSGLAEKERQNALFRGLEALRAAGKTPYLVGAFDVLLGL